MSRDSHIKPWLLGWTQQLRGWAEDGSLLAAAQQALLLEGAPQQLVELLDQWGASDFSALPSVETLSSQDIAGARGAYVEDLSQIFLNQEWLAEASDQEIAAVLTEELGHHLDAVLNDFDTPGDEGELFSAILRSTDESRPQQWPNDDQFIINIDGLEFEAEASSPASLSNPVIIASLTDDQGGFNYLKYPRDMTTAFIDNIPYAIIATPGDMSIQILSLEDPSQPANTSVIYENMGDFTAFANPHGVRTIEIGGVTYAVVTAWGEDAVSIVNLSDPSSPTLASFVRDGQGGFNELDMPHGVAVAKIGVKYYAMIASIEDDGVQIIDITDPTAPTAAASISHGESSSGGNYVLDGARRLTVADVGEKTLMLVASGTGSEAIQIIDVTDPTSPSVLSTITSIDKPSEISTAEIGGRHYAFSVSSPENSVQIIEFTDYSNPVKGYKFVDGQDGFNQLQGVISVELVKQGDSTFALFASQADDAVVIADVTNPSSPVYVSSEGLNNSRHIDSIEINNNLYGVVAWNDPGGFYVLDLGYTPSAPSSPDLHSDSDTGSSNTDNVTADTTPTLTGTSEANAIVELFDDGNLLGQITADSSGVWSFTVDSSGAFSDGSHAITAKAKTSSAGNLSSASSALTITIDASVPTAPSTPDLDSSSDTGSSNTDNVTSDSTPTFTGTAEASSTVELFAGVSSLGTTSTNGSGNWSLTSISNELIDNEPLSLFDSGHSTYNNQSTGGSNAWDDNEGTFVDFVGSGPYYTGADLGSEILIKTIAYYPRGGHSSRMVGGKFQASNNQLDWTDLHVISSSPQENRYTNVDLEHSSTYRYYRYFINGGNANIAEIQLYSGWGGASDGSYSITAKATDAAGNVSDASSALSITIVAIPTLSSATYDVSSGELTVTGTNFVKKNGSNNDIDISKLSITGEGGSSYTLTSTDVEVGSNTTFSVTLNADDQLNVGGLLNKNGTSSDGGTTYNLAAADNWVAGAAALADISDASSNGITVSNVANPTLSSAAYNAASGVLSVTGTNFVKENGSNNDIDVSKLSITGDGGSSYTLTSSDVEVSSNTQFSLTLNAADQLNVGGLLNKDGTSSEGGETYNLAAADNWLSGAAASVDISDASSNGITVSNVANPTLSSAAYNAASGVLTVTGTNFVKENGSNNDIDISKLSITGEGGSSYTLTSADVEVSSSTSFSVTLNAADQLNLGGFLNKNGTSSDGGTTYNLAAADNWVAGAAASADISDTSVNGITVSNVANPTLSSAVYDAASGELTVTGTNFVKENGSNNDIDISKLSITGEGGSSYTLTSTDVEVSSSTSFSVTLNAADQLNVGGVVE